MFGYTLVLCHADNLIPMNSLVTPAHIVPEWYFLQLFALLKLVPEYIMGILVVLVAMLLLSAVQ